ncbi:MAG: helix-turn-helix transcriptional regulator [Candidatus Aminicenantes bacterium]|nr:helix-turn-helix transcriptional regulator [Candidatus Aminicenantes bacterium]
MKKKERQDYLNEFSVRLKELRKALGLTQDRFSKELGISKPTYVRYELGEMMPKLQILSFLTTKYVVDLNWLLSGDGEMFLEVIELDEKYRELISYMQVPVVEQVIMGKLAELVATLKLDITNPRKNPGRNIRPKFVARPEITEKARNVRERKLKPSAYALERV